MTGEILVHNKIRVCAIILVFLLVLSNARLIEAQSVAPSIRKILICETVGGYGKCAERSSTVAPKDVFDAYSESTIHGIPKSGGNYFIRIQFAMKIIDPLGMIAQSSKSNIIEYESSHQETDYYWSVPVNCSKLPNLVNGEHLIKFELTDYARNLTTSADRKFTLAGGFPSEAVLRMNETMTFKNKGSRAVTVTMLRVADIPNVNPYQTVLDGPRINIAPQSQAEDGYGNRYSIFRNSNFLMIGPGSNVTITLSYVVNIKMMKIISQGTIPFTALQNLPPEIQKYLQPTQYIESDNRILKQTASGFREKSGDVVELIYLIHNFTANHVTYDYEALKDPKLSSSYNQDSALTTYTKGKGVCTNFSRLLVALMRAAGIPARIVAGYGFMQTVPYETYTESTTHEWTEVYLPGTGWIPVEPQVPGTLGFTLSSHVLNVWSDSEYKWKNEGYEAAVAYIQYWFTPSESPPELSEVMFHVETLPSAQYKPQYYLKLSTDQGVASGEGSYGYGTDVQFSVSTPVSPTGAQWVFDGWYDENGNLITTSAKGSIVMDRPHTLQAKWHLTTTASTATSTSSNVETLVLGFVILLMPVVVIILVVLYVRARPRRHRPAAPKAAAAMMPTAPPVAPSVRYCLQCGEQIPLDVNFCKHCGAKQS